MSKSLKKSLNTVSTVLVVLVVLLAVSGIALAGVVLHRYSAPPQASPAVVPDNVITPEKQTSAPAMQAAMLSCRTAKLADTGATPMAAMPLPVLSAVVDKAEGRNVTLKLYRNHAEDTAPFQVRNMFPGDVERKAYRLEVSYKGSVAVHFHADVRRGYEKLAEVLKCRVSLDGALLYDGLMKDMPESISRALPQSSGTTASLDYDITVYLETSVGNEYMGKELYADFRWWVNEDDSGSDNPSKPGGLIPPKTGDDSHIFLWVSVAGASALLLLLLLFLNRRKKEDDHEQR